MNKKMLLSVLIIGVVAVSAGAGTWATFTDTETSTGNSFTAGTVVLTKETESIQVGADNMKPGESKKLTIPISNPGSLDFNYIATVTTDSATSTSLFAEQGIDPTPAIASITSGASGTLTALIGSDSVVVTVSLPSTAGNDYQGDSGIVTVTITATQT